MIQLALNKKTFWRFRRASKLHGGDSKFLEELMDSYDKKRKHKRPGRKVQEEQKQDGAESDISSDKADIPT